MITISSFTETSCVLLALSSRWLVLHPLNHTHITHVSIPSHPLHSVGTGMDILNWDFGGSTVVTSSYVRLTPDRQSKRGILWNTVVCF